VWVNPNFDYRHQLVSVLERLDGIHERARRDRFVQELEQDLGHPLGIERSNRLHDDLWGLISACLAVPEALHKLGLILAAFHGKNVVVGRFLALAGAVQARPVLAARELDRIGEILTDAERDQVVEVSRSTLAAMGPRVKPDPTDFAAVIHALDDAMNTPGEPPRLLTFLVLLADRLRSPAAAELREWTETVAERLNMSTDVLDRIRAEPEQPSWSYLVVQLREDALDPTQYLLSVWLHNGRDNGDWELHLDDDAPRQLPAIRRQLNTVLGDLFHDPAARFGELAVEFILPLGLLGHDVDRWVFTSDGVSSPLGIHFPVVVRSLDRMRNNMVRPRWQRRCQWLRRNGDQPLAEAVRWKRVVATDNHSALLASLLDGRETPVCLVLQVPEEPGSDPGEAVAAGLQAGVPVILWCRNHEVSARFDLTMTQLLTGRGVKELPSLVLQLRREAARFEGPGDHPGRHVTLLWDDADRVPPGKPLQAPARREY
jgi:hypothetical protein